MAERRPKSQSLERVLGTGALFSTAYGNVGGSIYYALGLVAAYALGLTPLVFVITGVIFFFTAATYVEATTMFPEAGGSSSFARHAFNEFWSFFAAWGQMLNYTITAAISAYFVPHYLGVFWEPLGHAPGDIIFGIGVLIALGALNIIGVQESAKVNIVLSMVDFATQALLVIVGLVLVFNPTLLVQQVDFGTFPTVKNFLIAIPIGMVAYTGIETISNLAEEAKDFEKTVPASAKLVVAAVFAIYLFLPAIALSAMPVEHGVTLLGVPSEQGGFAGDPVLGIVEHMGLGALLGPVKVYVGLLAATILFISTNAGIIGVSRLTYSMGQHRQVPASLRKLHPKYKTPYVAIIFFGIIACITLIPGQATFLATMYTFGAMLSFTIAHVAVIKMRLDPTERSRPWSGPWNLKFGDRSVPLFAIFGGIGTFIAWVVITALNPTTLFVGVGWMLAGVVFYVLYRRHLGIPLTETHTIAMPKKIVDEAVEYDSILVVLEDGNFSEQAMETAIKMATRRSRGIHVMVPISVPASSPVDAVLPAQEAKAGTAIERARLLGGRRVTGRLQKLRAGETGRRIVLEAERINARAVIFPLRPDSSGSLFSPAVQYVLTERPCRVILTTEPKAAPVVAR